MGTPRRDIMRLGSLGVFSTVLPTAAAASSDVDGPTSGVTYLSNMGQARTGETTELRRSRPRHLQRCVAGETVDVNYGTAVYDVAGASASPDAVRIQLFQDDDGSVGDYIGQLDRVSHDESTGLVICANATPVEIPAGPFWAETYAAGNTTYFPRISGTSSTGLPGWSITDQARFGDPLAYGTIAYALEFSLGYQP